MKEVKRSPDRIKTIIFLTSDNLFPPSGKQICKLSRHLTKRNEDGMGDGTDEVLEIELSNEDGVLELDIF